MQSLVFINIVANILHILTKIRNSHENTKILPAAIRSFIYNFYVFPMIYNLNFPQFFFHFFSKFSGYFFPFSLFFPSIHPPSVWKSPPHIWGWGGGGIVLGEFPDSAQDTTSCELVCVCVYSLGRLPPGTLQETPWGDTVSSHNKLDLPGPQSIE